jgi:hypothetical protein
MINIYPRGKIELKKGGLKVAENDNQQALKEQA